MIAITNFNDTIERNDQCSLRDAIRMANGHLEKDACGDASESTVQHRDGPTRRGRTLRSEPGQIENEDSDDVDLAARGGDLDVAGEMIIHGCGHSDTFFDGAGHRVFEIWSGGSLKLERLTVRGGISNLGGAILNRGNFVAADVTFAQNLSEGDKGQVGRRDIVCGASGGVAVPQASVVRLPALKGV